MRKVLTAVAILLFSVASHGAITATLGEYSSPYHVEGSYYDLYNVGTFAFDLTGLDVVSATISGQWGNTECTTTAHNELWLDGIKIADTYDYYPSPAYTPITYWSYTFNPSQLSIFDDGLANFVTIQTANYVVRLGETTLSLETVPAQAVPVPGAMALGCIGVCVAGWLKKRKAI